MFVTIEELNEICKSSKKLIGIDWGEVSIGVAVSDALGIAASPLCTLLFKKKKRDGKKKDADTFHEEIISKISSLILVEAPKAVIIGLPLNMNGSTGPQASKVKIFAEELAEKVNLPILLQDERLSTRAIERLYEDEMTYIKLNKSIDKLSAAFVLQGVLDFLTKRENRAKSW